MIIGGLYFISCRGKKIKTYFSCHLMAAPAEKLQALILAESMVSILGEKWLIGPIKLPNVEEPIPADR